ncbi:MAG: hypothetical protein WCE51_08895, partial [Chthoniobacterales bacterium]
IVGIEVLEGKRTRLDDALRLRNIHAPPLQAKIAADETEPAPGWDYICRRYSVFGLTYFRPK